VTAIEGARRRWGLQLTVDWARRPAYLPEELAALLMSDEEYAAVIEAELAEADR